MVCKDCVTIFTRTKINALLHSSTKPKQNSSIFSKILKTSALLLEISLGTPFKNHCSKQYFLLASTKGGDWFHAQAFNNFVYFCFYRMLNTGRTRKQVLPVVDNSIRQFEACDQIAS